MMPQTTPKRESASRRLALLAIGVAVLTSGAATLISPGWFRLVHLLPGGDKTGHFIIMGTVSFLVTLAFASARIRGRRVELGAMGCILMVGAVVTVDEFLQLLFPTRSFSLGDLLANRLGILSFGAAAWLVLRARARRRERA